MGRRGHQIAEIIKNEAVRVATNEEAESINFKPRTEKSQKSRDLSKLLERDPSLRKVFNILQESPDATVLVIDTDNTRMSSLRLNLQRLGLVTETRQAVSGYGERSEPLTIAIRKLRLVQGPEKEVKPVTDEPIVRHWEK